MRHPKGGALGLDERTLELLGKIYDAAFAPELWSDVVVDLVEAIAPGGSGGMLFFPSPGCPPQIVDPTIDPAFARSYAEHYRSMDPAPRQMARVPSGGIFVASRDGEPAALRGTEFYNDWLRPQGIGDGVGLHIDEPACGASVALALKRPDRVPCYGPSEVAYVERLVPHLRRAARAFWLLQRAHAERRALGDALDGVAHAVFFVDARRRVLRMNRAAERLVAAPDGLGIIEGRLACDEPRGTEALEGRLLSYAAGEGPPRAWTVAAARRSGGRPLALHLVPISREVPALGVEPCVAAVFVCDPAALRLPPRAVVEALFGLTASESEVALAVLGGKSPKEIAALRRTSLHTAKNQLRAVFKKTRTSGQVELARLLAGCVPPAG